jgi:hypothetical protein
MTKMAVVIRNVRLLIQGDIVHIFILDFMSTKDSGYVKYYLVGCPECNKDLDYTRDVKIDQSYANVVSFS